MKCPKCGKEIISNTFFSDEILSKLFQGEEVIADNNIKLSCENGIISLTCPFCNEKIKISQEDLLKELKQNDTENNSNSETSTDQELPNTGTTDTENTEMNEIEEQKNDVDSNSMNYSSDIFIPQESQMYLGRELLIECTLKAVEIYNSVYTVSTQIGDLDFDGVEKYFVDGGEAITESKKIAFDPCYAEQTLNRLNNVIEQLGGLDEDAAIEGLFTEDDEGNVLFKGNLLDLDLFKTTSLFDKIKSNLENRKDGIAGNSKLENILSYVGETLDTTLVPSAAMTLMGMTHRTKREQELYDKYYGEMEKRIVEDNDKKDNNKDGDSDKDITINKNVSNEYLKVFGILSLDRASEEDDYASAENAMTYLAARQEEILKNLEAGKATEAELAEITSMNLSYSAQVSQIYSQETAKINNQMRANEVRMEAIETAEREKSKSRINSGSLTKNLLDSEKTQILENTIDSTLMANPEYAKLAKEQEILQARINDYRDYQEVTEDFRDKTIMNTPEYPELSQNRIASHEIIANNEYGAGGDKFKDDVVYKDKDGNVIKDVSSYEAALYYAENDLSVPADVNDANNIKQLVKGFKEEYMTLEDFGTCNFYLNLALRNKELDKEARNNEAKARSLEERKDYVSDKELEDAYGLSHQQNPYGSLYQEYIRSIDMNYATQIIEDCYDDIMREKGYAHAEQIEKRIKNTEDGRGLIVAIEGLKDGGWTFIEGFGYIFQDVARRSARDYKNEKLNTYLIEEQGKGYQYLYEFSSVMGNMAPVMVISALLGPEAGRLAMGLSAGGNAKRDALFQGLDPVEATFYGILSGSSEVLLETFIGAIPGVSNMKGLLAIPGIKGFLAKMISEGSEEGLQEILAPFLLATAQGWKNDDGSAITFEEVWNSIDDDAVRKSFIFGALSAGLLNSPKLALDTASYVKTGDAGTFSNILNMKIQELLAKEGLNPKKMRGLNLLKLQKEAFAETLGDIQKISSLSENVGNIRKSLASNPEILEAYNNYLIGKNRGECDTFDVFLSTIATRTALEIANNTNIDNISTEIIEGFKIQKEKIQQDIDNKTKAHEEKTARKAEIDNELEKINNEMEQLDNECKTKVEQREKAIEEGAKEKSKKIKDLDKEIADLKQKYTDLRNERTNILNKSVNLELDLMQLQSGINKLSKDIEIIDGKIATANSETVKIATTQFAKEIANLLYPKGTEQASFTQRIQEYLDKLINKDNIVDMTQNVTENYNKLLKNLEELNSELDYVDKVIDNKRSNNKSTLTEENYRKKAKREIERINEQLNEFNKKFKELDIDAEKVADLQSEYAEAQKTKEQLESKIAELEERRSKLDKYDKEAIDLGKQIEQIKNNQLERYNERLKHLETELGNINERINLDDIKILNTPTKNNSSIKEQLKELYDKFLGKSDNDYVNPLENLEATEENYQSLLNEIEVLKEGIANLESGLMTSNTESYIESFKKQITTLEEQANNMKLKLAENVQEKAKVSDQVENKTENKVEDSSKNKVIEETKNTKKTDSTKEQPKQTEQTQTKDINKTDTKTNSETTEKSESTKTSKQEQTPKTTEMVFESEPGEVIDINSMNLDFVEDPSNTYITVDGKRYRVSDILEARKNNKNTEGKSKVEKTEQTRRNVEENKATQKNSKVNETIQNVKKASSEFAQKVTDKVNKVIDALTNDKLAKMDKEYRKNNISKKSAESKIKTLEEAYNKNIESAKNIIRESLLKQGYTDNATINNIIAEVLRGKIEYVTRADGIRNMISNILSKNKYYQSEIAKLNDIINSNVNPKEANPIDARMERLANQAKLENQWGSEFYYKYVNEKKINLTETWNYITNNYSGIKNLKLLIWDNGKFYNFSIGQNIDTALSNSYKIYVPINETNATSVTGKIIDYLVENNITSDNKISKTLRSDALVLRISDKADATNVIKFINENLDIKLDGSELPLSYRVGNVSVSMDGGTSYNGIVSSLLKYYFNNIDKVQYPTFGKFVSEFKSQLINDGGTDLIDPIFTSDYRSLKNRFSSETNDVLDTIDLANANIYEIIDILDARLNKNLSFEEYMNFLEKYQSNSKIKDVINNLNSSRKGSKIAMPSATSDFAIGDGNVIQNNVNNIDSSTQIQVPSEIQNNQLYRAIIANDTNEIYKQLYSMKTSKIVEFVKNLPDSIRASTVEDIINFYSLCKTPQDLANILISEISSPEIVKNYLSKLKSSQMTEHMATAFIDTICSLDATTISEVVANNQFLLDYITESNIDSEKYKAIVRRLDIISVLSNKNFTNMIKYLSESQVEEIINNTYTIDDIRIAQIVEYNPHKELTAKLIEAMLNSSDVAARMKAKTYISMLLSDYSLINTNAKNVLSYLSPELINNNNKNDSIYFRVSNGDYRIASTGKIDSNGKTYYSYDINGMKIYSQMDVVAAYKNGDVNLRNYLANEFLSLKHINSGIRILDGYIGEYAYDANTGTYHITFDGKTLQELINDINSNSESDFIYVELPDYGAGTKIKQTGTVNINGKTLYVNKFVNELGNNTFYSDIDIVSAYKNGDLSLREFIVNEFLGGEQIISSQFVYNYLGGYVYDATTGKYKIINSSELIKGIQNKLASAINLFESARGNDTKLDFGVDQHVAANILYTEYGYDVINTIAAKYNASIDDVESIMNVLDSVGACSYANVCNEIFMLYKNRPDLFKSHFGYDMYNQKGELNTAKLLTDLYIYSNTSNTTGGHLFEIDVNGNLKIIPGSKIESQQYLSNTNKGMNITIINGFLEKNNSSFRLSSERVVKLGEYNLTITQAKLVQELKNRLLKGELLSLHERSEGKEIVFENLDNPLEERKKTTHNWGEGGGHATTIIGITENGLIISSWGNKYLIKFSDLDSNNFVINALKISDINSQK